MKKQLDEMDRAWLFWLVRNYKDECEDIPCGNCKMQRRLMEKLR
jgi:hypothetical protein